VPCAAIKDQLRFEHGHWNFQAGHFSFWRDFVDFEVLVIVATPGHVSFEENVLFKRCDFDAELQRKAFWLLQVKDRRFGFWGVDVEGKSEERHEPVGGDSRVRMVRFAEAGMEFGHGTLFKGLGVGRKAGRNIDPDPLQRGADRLALSNARWFRVEFEAHYPDEG
jgi:hypothetical protein